MNCEHADGRGSRLARRTGGGPITVAGTVTSGRHGGLPQATRYRQELPAHHHLRVGHVRLSAGARSCPRLRRLQRTQDVRSKTQRSSTTNNYLGSGEPSAKARRPSLPRSWPSPSSAALPPLPLFPTHSHRAAPVITDPVL